MDERVNNAFAKNLEEGVVRITPRRLTPIDYIR